MHTARSEINWAPRLAKDKLRRLYQSEADGRTDTNLLDEVGMTLLLRCESILDVEAAKRGHVRCPRCQANGVDTVIRRKSRARDEIMTCPVCGWSLDWADYARTFKRKQLNLGGAGHAFEDFARGYPRCQTPRDKMLAIDRLIHEFHYSLKTDPDRPTRACAVNLIAGDLNTVVRFLDELSGLTQDDALADSFKTFRGKCAEAGHWHPQPGD